MFHLRNQYQKVLDEFNFGSYRSSVILILNDSNRNYLLNLKILRIQNLLTLNEIPNLIKIYNFYLLVTLR
jgi:hypothetical protein